MDSYYIAAGKSLSQKFFCVFVFFPASTCADARAHTRTPAEHLHYFSQEVLEISCSHLTSLSPLTSKPSAQQQHSLYESCLTSNFTVTKDLTSIRHLLTHTNTNPCPVLSPFPVFLFFLFYFFEAEALRDGAEALLVAIPLRRSWSVNGVTLLMPAERGANGSRFPLLAAACWGPLLSD